MSSSDLDSEAVGHTREDSDSVNSGTLSSLTKEDGVLVKPQRARSWVWAYFRKYSKDCPQKEHFVFCEVCENDVKYGASQSPQKMISHMFYHHRDLLAQFHPDILADLSKKSKMRSSMKSSAAPSPMARERKRWRHVEPEEETRPVVKQHILRSYINWVTTSYKPIAMCDSPSFQSFWTLLGDVRLSSADVLAGEYLLVAFPLELDVIYCIVELSAVQDELKEAVAEVLRKQSFSVAVEAIENAESARFMHLTCHYVSDNFKMETHTLSCEYTAINWPPEVSSHILKAMDSLKISKGNLCSITSLESSNIEQITFSPSQLVVKVNCMAEILYDITSDLTLSGEEFSGIHSALRMAQKCFYSFQRNHHHRDKLHELGLSAVVLEFGEKTVEELSYSSWWINWNVWSTLRQLKSYYQQFDFLKEEYTFLSEEQWRLCEVYHAAISPMAAVLEEILNGGDSINQYISSVPCFVCHIKRELQRKLPNSDPILIHLCDHFLKKLSDHFRWIGTSDYPIEWNDLSGASLVAAALDPRFKGLQGVSSGTTALVWAKIKELAQGEMNETNPLRPSEYLNLGVFSSMTEEVSSESPVEREIRQYIAETPLYVNAIIDGKKSFSNPLQWWKERSIIYPRLAVLVRRWLCIPAFSKLPELFYCPNADKFMDLNQRSELPSSTLGNVVFVGDTLNLITDKDTLSRILKP
jgi:hypothetical protein